MRIPNTKEVILPRASLEHIPERKEIVDKAVDWALRVSYAEIVARIPSQETTALETTPESTSEIVTEKAVQEEPEVLADNIIELNTKSDELDPQTALRAAMEVYDEEEAA